MSFNQCSKLHLSHIADGTESYQLTGSVNFQQQRLKWLTISVTFSSINFHENPSSPSRLVPVQTDRQTAEGGRLTKSSQNE